MWDKLQGYSIKIFHALMELERDLWERTHTHPIEYTNVSEPFTIDLHLEKSILYSDFCLLLTYEPNHQLVMGWSYFCPNKYGMYGHRRLEGGVHNSRSIPET